MGTYFRQEGLSDVTLKLILEELGMKDNVLGRGNTVCEGSEAVKSWVFIRNRETQYGHNPGKGKISRWKVSSDQIVPGLEGHGKLS